MDIYYNMGPPGMRSRERGGTYVISCEVVGFRNAEFRLVCSCTVAGCGEGVEWRSSVYPVIVIVVGFSSCMLSRIFLAPLSL